jgi:hypothetical protein
MMFIRLLLHTAIAVRCMMFIRLLLYDACCSYGYCCNMLHMLMELLYARCSSALRYRTKRHAKQLCVIDISDIQTTTLHAKQLCMPDIFMAMIFELNHTLSYCA